MAHVTVERWEAVKDAVHLRRSGLDFAELLELFATMYPLQAGRQTTPAE